LPGAHFHEPPMRLPKFSNARLIVAEVGHVRRVHAEVVADLADDHLARVLAHAHPEVQTAREPELVGKAIELFAQIEGSVARPLRMILMSDRGAEHRYDAVAGVLIYRPN